MQEGHIILHTNAVSKQIDRNHPVFNLSFSMAQGQKLAIAGESGSGKSTLLKMIAGLLQPDSGEIFFKGKKIKGPDEQLIPGQPGIAYLSQHFELRNNYRVEEILSYANEMTEQDAVSIYSLCRISHLLPRMTHELSGGEKQRVALASLLTNAPSLLLLDEPYSNLDAIHQQIMRTVIRNLGERLPMNVLMVSHDAADMLSWASHILVMKEGQVIQQGSPEEIYRQPVNEYCAALFGEYCLLSYETCQMFMSVPEPGNRDKKLFTRPEYFIIQKGNTNTNDGTVREIIFRGSYYMIDIQTGNQLIRVKSNHADFTIGETIQLLLNTSYRWFI